jgi:hypothetical protein
MQLCQCPPTPRGPLADVYRPCLTQAYPAGTHIKSTPARLIGYVQAPDAEQAVKEAIARYGIDTPKSRPGWPEGRAEVASQSKR